MLGSGRGDHGQTRIRVNTHTSVGGGGGVPPFTVRARSRFEEGCDDGCGRRRGVVGRGRSHHREVGGRVTASTSSSMGVGSTECFVNVDNRSGDISSRADSHIIIHMMGDRDVSGTGVSLVMNICVRGLGGSLVLLIVFVDIREMGFSPLVAPIAATDASCLAWILDLTGRRAPRRSCSAG